MKFVQTAAQVPFAAMPIHAGHAVLEKQEVALDGIGQQYRSPCGYRGEHFHE
jgi:hypothetical protein